MARMRLVVGLGNPGKEYERMRHNAGWRAVDAFYDAHRDAFGGWEKKFGALVAEGRMGERKMALMKPQTYINASGDAVAVAVGFWKLDASRDVLVVFDDFALPVGATRYRDEGSAGGHNGMQSVLEQLGTQAVPRLRIGIGSELLERMDGADFVLSRFTAEEEEKLAPAVADAVREIEGWISK